MLGGKQGRICPLGEPALVRALVKLAGVLRIGVAVRHSGSVLHDKVIFLVEGDNASTRAETDNTAALNNPRHREKCQGGSNGELH